MPNLKFGERSERQLATVHLDLQMVLREALAMGLMDMTVIEGHRGQERQDAFYNADPPKSKVPFPKGKHNRVPSDAVDVAPYVNGKISWNKLHCCVLAGIILTCAKKLGVPVRWGGNWDMDLEPITDQDFQDLVHFERIGA